MTPPSGKDVIISTYDVTGNMVIPWVEAGYTAYIVDILHPRHQVTEIRPRLFAMHADLRPGWLPPRRIAERCAFFAAFPPCDDIANSGNRWKKGKGLRKLAAAVDMFATAAELAEWLECPYLIENPVGSMSTYWRKADYSFDPMQYTLLETGDNYWKETLLWTSEDFEMPPEQRDFTLGEPDERIHKAPPSEDRGAIRSVTPMGFARAVFLANCEFFK